MQEYPLPLLPSKEFKLSITLPASKLDSLYLIRRSLVAKEETTNDLGAIRSHAFIEPKKEHLFFSLSCNLLGIFLSDDLIFVLTDKENGNGYWADKSKIINIADVHYEIVADPCPIYLQLSKIHQQPFHYEKPTPSNKGVHQFTGSCHSVHKPLDANYWHFEIHVYEPDGFTRISANSSGWKREAVRHFIESYLKRYLTIEQPIPAPKVDETLYRDY